MAETNLGFSKIVATPTPTAWSQAYSAGHLFAVFSLTTLTPHENLINTGKDLISTFESEFFTLESKSLESIKQALLTTTARIQQNISTSFVVCYFTEDVLYLFATGGGKAILKRGEKIGTVLDTDDSSNIKSASGNVKDHDLIVLETKNFQKIISPSTLASALDNDIPDEIAEDLTPHVHDKTEGGASALILNYKIGAIDSESAAITAALSEEAKNKENNANVLEETKESDPEDIVTEENETPEEITDSPLEPKEILDIEPNPIQASSNPEQVHEFTKPTEEPASDNFSNLSSENPLEEIKPPKKKRSPFGFIKKISGRRKIILLVAVILFALIIIIAILAISNKNSNKNQALFNDIYTQAQTKYDEGQNLKDLNAPLAQESFKSAQALLNSNVNSFKEGSKERQRIDALLKQINQELAGSSGGSTVTEAKEVEKTVSKLLSYQIDNPDASYFAQGKDNVYFLDGSGISKIDTGNDKKIQIVKKSWKTDGGIGAFGSNVYILDRADGILKFVPSDDTYVKSNYFSGDTPDFTSSTAMTIDGSIYVLNKDGSIEKFTKGTKDDFSISGIDKPLNGATRIFTNENSDNVYILDNTNSRIVVLNKTGKFIKSYSASIIKNAKDIDVSEAEKKIFVLSGGKVYQIDIK